MKCARFLLPLLVWLSACGGPVSQPEIPVGTGQDERTAPVSGVLPSGEKTRVGGGRGAVTVLVFYRGSGCGLCRAQLERIQSNLPAYSRLDASVVALTLDPPASTAALLESLPLDFPILSVDTAVFEEWGVLEAGREAPLPATFVLDGEGVVRYRYIGRNAGDRALDAEVLTAIQLFEDH
ncbi:MAG: peroxiredoxin family protein [Gemmatimonadota bacterium]|nr:peroxiredoxin family protein [Gemmatimonadota bacterium]